MFQALSNVTSAVRAYTRGMSASAQNVANASTEGFHPVRAIYQEDANGGVICHVEVEQRGEVDLGEEIVNQITDQAAAEANVAAFRAIDQTLGVLLDTVG